jgi:hypothetical protein
MPTCYTDGVALQPSCGAGVVLARADMVQPSEGIYSYPYAPFHRNGCSIRWAGGLIGLPQLS